MATAFCSYQLSTNESGRSLTSHSKAPGQGDGDLHGRVGVVALADVQQPRDAADIAEVEFVEAVFSAGERENDAIVRARPGQIR